MDSVELLTPEQLDKLIVRYLRKGHVGFLRVTATAWQVCEPGSRCAVRTLEAEGNCPDCGARHRLSVTADDRLVNLGEPGPRNDFKIRDVREVRSLFVCCLECPDESGGGAFVLTPPAEVVTAKA